MWQGASKDRYNRYAGYDGYKCCPGASAAGTTVTHGNLASLQAYLVHPRRT